MRDHRSIQTCCKRLELLPSIERVLRTLRIDDGSIELRHGVPVEVWQPEGIFRHHPSWRNDGKVHSRGTRLTMR